MAASKEFEPEESGPSNGDAATEQQEQSVAEGDV